MREGHVVPVFWLTYTFLSTPHYFSFVSYVQLLRSRFLALVPSFATELNTDGTVARA